MMEVVVYTKDYCPYCQSAKALLEEKGVEYKEIDVTNDEEKLKEMLAKSNGRTTVPEIFVGETLVGGYDDLREMDESGELDKLLGLE